MNDINTASKSASASVISAVFAVIFVTIITVAADLAPALKAWLASIFSHHWIGKGVIASAIFVLFCLLLTIFGKSQDDETLAAQIQLLNAATAAGALIIFAFFIYETFWK